jgi:hypothetical protein
LLVACGISPEKKYVTVYNEGFPCINDDICYTECTFDPDCIYNDVVTEVTQLTEITELIELTEVTNETDVTNVTEITEVTEITNEVTDVTEITVINQDECEIAPELYYGEIDYCGDNIDSNCSGDETDCTGLEIVSSVTNFIYPFSAYDTQYTGYGFDIDTMSLIGVSQIISPDVKFQISGIETSGKAILKSIGYISDISIIKSIPDFNIYNSWYYLNINFAYTIITDKGELGIIYIKSIDADSVTFDAYKYAIKQTGSRDLSLFEDLIESDWDYLKFDFSSATTDCFNVDTKQHTDCDIYLNSFSVYNLGLSKVGYLGYVSSKEKVRKINNDNYFIIQNNPQVALNQYSAIAFKLADGRYVKVWIESTDFYNKTIELWYTVSNDLF